MQPVATQGREFKDRQARFMDDLAQRLAGRPVLDPEVIAQLPRSFPALLPNTRERPLVPKQRVREP